MGEERVDPWLPSKLRRIVPVYSYTDMGEERVDPWLPSELRHRVPVYSYKDVEKERVDPWKLGGREVVYLPVQMRMERVDPWLLSGGQEVLHLVEDMGKAKRDPWLLSELSRLRYGDLAAAGDLNDLFLLHFGLELVSWAIEGSAKLCWVLDIRHDRYFRTGFLSELDSELRRMNAIQTLLNDWFESGRRTLRYSLRQSVLSQCSPEEPSEASILSYAVVVSALVLLSLVYQYLTGNVDRGGSKAYSRSSLDFRDVYVAIVLFLGAYVWIKFREVALKGAHPRKLPDRQGGTRVVYEARLTPPNCNHEKVPRLDLGRFATPQEAHNKFLIAAFYYNRGAGLLDGWFQVPPMSEEERSLAGLEKRRWVIGQAKKVYEDFKKKEAEAKEKEEAASLLQEFFEVWDGQLLPEQDEGLVLSNGHNLGSGGGSALPVSQLPPNTECLNGSDQLDLPQTRVSTPPQQISLQDNQISDPQQQISLQQQVQGLVAQISDPQQQFSLLQQVIHGLVAQISDPQQQISLLQQQVQGLVAQILQLPRQQRIQQQQLLQESLLQNPQWSYQFGLEQQQLQDVNQGFPSFEVEMEQSIHQQNYSGFMTLPHDGGEVQGAFSELDALMYM